MPLLKKRYSARDRCLEDSPTRASGGYGQLWRPANSVEGYCYGPACHGAVADHDPYQGLGELHHREAGSDLPRDRIRSPGDGRKRLTENFPTSSPGG